MLPTGRRKRNHFATCQVHTKTYTKIFRRAVFTTARTKKQPRHLSLGKWINYANLNKRLLFST